MTDSVTQFIAAMEAHGVVPAEPVSHKLASGLPFRFQAEGDKPGHRNGWACLHLDGIPAGVFRHYRLGLRVVWRADNEPGQRSPEERRQYRSEVRQQVTERKAAMIKQHEEVANSALHLWSKAKPADPHHPYLARKGILNVPVRQYGGALIVPLMDRERRIWNVQRILPDGGKFFLAGGITNGMFWPHGAYTGNDWSETGPLVVGEGFATMAAVHQATGLCVIAAMSAHNVMAVARALRHQFPNRPFVIAADDDNHLPLNVGMAAAEEAASSVGAILALPRQRHSLAEPNCGIDFADLGAAEIRSCFEHVLEVPSG